MTTRRYFYICIALPVAMCLLGGALDPRTFAPILMVGSIVYLPVALYAWWRIRSAIDIACIQIVSAVGPIASSLLLCGVFLFPQIFGGSNGDPLVALIGLFVALIVGYVYVLIAWTGYSLLKKTGLVANEFAA